MSSDHRRSFSPSPYPSPSGRGKSLVRSRAIRAALDPVAPSGSEGESGDRTTRMHESSEGGRRVSLSLGERAGVRGNVVPARPRCTIELRCVSGAGSRSVLSRNAERRETGAEFSMGDRHDEHRPKDLNAHDGAGSRNDSGSPVRLTRMRSGGTGAFSDVCGPRGAFWSAAVFCRSETLANDLATRRVGLRRASLRVCARRRSSRRPTRLRTVRGLGF